MKIFDTEFDIFKEIENIRGTGLIDFDSDGYPIGEIVKVDKKIGFGGKNKLIQTNIISIRYSKTGSHAFPVDPADYDNVRIKKRKNLYRTHDPACHRRVPNRLLS